MKKSALIIGIDPHYLDFSSKEFSAFPNIDANMIRAGLNGSAQKLMEAGYEAEICWIDLGETAQSAVKIKLLEKQFDVVMIGAGIRVPESNVDLFENLINTVISNSPSSKIAFNKNPQDTLAAVQRWI